MRNLLEIGISHPNQQYLTSRGNVKIPFRDILRLKYFFKELKAPKTVREERNLNQKESNLFY